MKKTGRYYRLLVAAQILWLVSVLFAWSFRPGHSSSNMLRAYADINGGLKTTLGMFEVDCGRFPTTKEGLKLLVSPSTNIENWHGPYLDPPATPEDPWGLEYVYRCPGVYNTNGYDLYSLGPDGVSKTGGNDSDDIGNWEKPTRSGGSWDTETVFQMAYLSLLFIPFLFGVRVVAGIVSPRVRAAGMKNRLLDWIWFALAVVTIIIVFMPKITGRVE